MSKHKKQRTVPQNSNWNTNIFLDERGDLYVPIDEIADVLGIDIVPILQAKVWDVEMRRFLKRFHGRDCLPLAFAWTMVRTHALGSRRSTMW